MKLNLTTATDAEINALCAEVVAKLDDVRRFREGPYQLDVAEDYVNDANAVLPLLEKWDARIACIEGPLWEVVLYRSNAHHSSEALASAPTFPRAATLALLKANGVEVIG